VEFLFAAFSVFSVVKAVIRLLMRTSLWSATPADAAHLESCLCSGPGVWLVLAPKLPHPSYRNQRNGIIMYPVAAQLPIKLAREGLFNIQR